MEINENRAFSTKIEKASQAMPDSGIHSIMELFHSEAASSALWALLPLYTSVSQVYRRLTVRLQVGGGGGDIG